ncbi:DUF1240 domain-containing protein [Pseudoalteromonas sp. N1230-9]|uniref:DUF1240 domain-containing protein n=1 Tax=Pseudoalteromonas sp. N1230-9 TaxID=2907156 RepID=UPI002B2F3F3C|nr:DUF1240 domain-containing protein [Pseudoalteromonas sp. N1230-9]
MSLLKWEKSEERFSDLKLKNKIIFFLAFIFFLGMGWGYIYGSYYGLVNHILIDDSLFYISEFGYAAPLIFFIPFPLFIIIAGIQKALDYKNDKTSILMLKSMCFAIPLYFIFSIICSFYIEANLKNHGYTYCSWYKYSPTRSPDVWLKNSELCLKVHHYVVSDVEEWFEWHNEQGIEPQLDELKAFIAKKNKEQGR